MIRPRASGIFVVPVEKELMKAEDDGMKYPMDTPIAIATNIHKVKYRSRKLSFFLSCAGAQLVAVMESKVGNAGCPMPCFTTAPKLGIWSLGRPDEG